MVWGTLQVQKSLKASLMADQTNIGMNVTEKNGSDSRSVSVNLSTAEFLVAAEMCRFHIPKALGMDRR